MLKITSIRVKGEGVSYDKKTQVHVVPIEVFMADRDNRLLCDVAVYSIWFQPG